MCRLKQSPALDGGARKGSSLMSEEFTLNQRLIDRAAM
jgi:hypothetical protein